MAVAERVPLGKILLDKGLVSEGDLYHALVAQQVSGDKIGRILLARGSLNAYKLHLALAEHYGTDFADLRKNPPDLSLINSSYRKRYLEMEALPWRKENGKVVIAATDIDKKVKEWAAEEFGECRFVITSPYDIYWTVQDLFAKEDDDDARNRLWEKKSEKSAKKAITLPDWLDSITLIAIFGAIAIFFDDFVKSFFIIINLFYLFTMLFKITIFSLGGFGRKYDYSEEFSSIDERELPRYSLLVPMYKEKEKTIKNLLEAVRNLNYPKAKLDIKLIVEADDKETIDIIKKLKPENIFEIIRVPYSIPRTKPKALNYALRFAKGEYVTIYDAEDKPEPDQLKKVIAKFRANRNPNMVCVQARLNYYNKDENILTRMFAIEYSSWFDFMLNGLEKLGIPIPLGGTSNHFPLKVLEELYAWDPYNVTEDADLGIRLAESGYKTTMVDSYTLEESPVKLGAWLKQRSRWIKGYIQTYFVHMRKPMSLLYSLGFRGFFGFQFFVGAPAVVFLTIPFMFLASGLFVVKDYGLPPIFMYTAFGNLGFGFALQLSIALIVLIANRWWKMTPYTLLFPFYWVLHSIASFRAVWELIKRPHYWEKTEHGVSKMLG